MSDVSLNLHSAPIVEAVVEVECDMPPTFDLGGIETRARDVFRTEYPKIRVQFLEEHQITNKGGDFTEHRTKRGIQAYHFLHDDEKQLVQVRAQGFAFNRLAPYGSLDDYLKEIERTWTQFRSLVSPVQIRNVRLRYINRILLPMAGDALQLQDYLRVSPQLPNESNLTFVGFLNQHSAIEAGTGNQANIVLATLPIEGERLPVIFDIAVNHPATAEPDDWKWIADKIQSLRDLKNRVFKNTLTPQCLNLFQHSAL